VIDHLLAIKLYSVLLCFFVFFEATEFARNLPSDTICLCRLPDHFRDSLCEQESS